MNPRQWMKDRSINPDIALEAGVMYDSNQNALLFPRLDLNGERIGWKVRSLGGVGMYNHPSGIALKDTQPFIAKKGTGALCICEGETDALALASWAKAYGLEDAHIVAVPGATTFNNTWASLYAEFDRVYLFPDPDLAGEKMIEKICGLIPRARVVRLEPEVGDLNTSIQENFLGVYTAIQEAQSVRVKAKLRHFDYDFKQTHGVAPHVLVDVVNRDIGLKPRANEYTGLCPFHNEKTPSFMVNPKKGVYYCHGCGARGDIISYFKERDGLSYRDAYRKAQQL